VNPERLGTGEEARGDSERSHVGDSLGEYARRVIGHWWWLVLGLLATCLGVYSVMVAHVLAVRSWVWFAIALGTFSVAQFLAFHEVRKERNEVLTAPAQDKVSVYAVAASRGAVPPPILAPLDYQLHALREALAFFRAEGYQEINATMLDSALKRVERDGIKLAYEPVNLYDCDQAVQRLTETGELVAVPARHGWSLQLTTD
jgi:hypothetical protein